MQFIDIRKMVGLFLGAYKKSPELEFPMASKVQRPRGSFGRGISPVAN